jgi:hypothetical protein
MVGVGLSGQLYGVSHFTDVGAAYCWETVGRGSHIGKSIMISVQMWVYSKMASHVSNRRDC